MNRVETKKFNDNTISIRTFMPFCASTITKINILLYMMKSKTEDFHSKQLLASALNDAYGLKAIFGLNAYGNQVAFDARFQYIREEWIQDDSYMDQVTHIIDQIIFHPVFDETNLEEAKYFLRTRLLRQQDDSDSYALTKALRQIQIGHSIATPVLGYMDEIDTITLEDIQDMYDEYLRYPKHVFFVGSCHPKMQTFLERLDSNTKVEISSSIIKTNEVFSQEEVRDIAQSSLVEVYQTNIPIQSKQYYALLVMNSMLGQCPNNLLFKEVREKNSYCYSIHTSLIRFDGALVVHCGTRNAYIDHVQELVRKQIQKLIDQSYEDELMSIAKMDLIDGITSGKDYPFSMIEQAFLDEALSRTSSLEQRIETIQAITKEDISEVASLLRLCSQFIVKEAHDEEV